MANQKRRHCDGRNATVHNRSLDCVSDAFAVIADVIDDGAAAGTWCWLCSCCWLQCRYCRFECCSIGVMSSSVCAPLPHTVPQPHETFQKSFRDNGFVASGTAWALTHMNGTQSVQRYERVSQNSCSSKNGCYWRRCGGTDSFEKCVKMLVVTHVWAAHANFQHLRCHGPQRRQCSHKTACARPPPRLSVAGRLARKRIRQPRGASHARHVKGAMGHRRLSCGRLPCRACGLPKIASSMLGLAIIACVKAASAALICLRSATHPSFRLRSLSVSSWISSSASLSFFFRRIAMGFAHFSQLPRSIAPFLFQRPACTCTICLVVGIRVPPACASSLALQRSEIRLATSDSIGLILSELRLHLHCPRKHSPILCRLRQQPSGRQHLRTSHQRIFKVLGVCSFFSEQPSCRAAARQSSMVLEKVDSFN